MGGSLRKAFVAEFGGEDDDDDGNEGDAGEATAMCGHGVGSLRTRVEWLGTHRGASG
jgi:hypothetical protein